MRRRRNPEIIAGRVNADGTTAAGDGFTVQKTATGTYVVTITAPGFRLLAAVACATIVNQSAAAAAQNDRVFNITVYFCTTGALTDQPSAFQAVGVQQ